MRRSLPEKAPELPGLLGPLVKHGVDFIMIGGLAGIARGSSYPSYDLDIAYAHNPANIVRLVAALKEIRVRLRNAPPDLPFVLDERTIENGSNFTFETPHGDFDILAHVEGIRTYEELLAASTIEDVKGFSVHVASIDHLISMKRAANRTKDKLMLEDYLVIADEQRRLDEEGES